MKRTSQTHRGADLQNLLFPSTATRIGIWNVRTLFETGKSAQATREMDRYGLDILGLSEVRWTGDGEQILASGHVLLYSGLPKEDNVHMYGVGLMLTKKAKKALIEWEPINERILTARFHSKFQKVTIIQCYAPTNTSPQEEKDIFYEQLQATLEKGPKRDITLVMGDLNAKVGNDNKGREAIMGSHGHGLMNENGELFTDFCEQNDLVIGSTIFPHLNIHKITWISPDQKTKNQIDHMAISQRWRRTLMDVRTYRGADIGSDHFLVIGKLRVKIKAVKKTLDQRNPKFDLGKLKIAGKKEEFTIALRNKFEALANLEEDSLEDKWDKVKKTFTETSKEELGYRKREFKSWLTDATISKIEERREIKQKLNQAKTRTQKLEIQKEYKTKDIQVKRSARNDKRNLIDGLANEAEDAAGKNDMKTLYNITRQLSGRKSNTNRPIRKQDGTILSKPTEQLERWKEHFHSLLNSTPIANPPEIEEGEEMDIDLTPIRKEEIVSAIRKMKNGKSEGPDSIPPEVLKANANATADILIELLQEAWDKEDIPNDWRTGYIIKLPKKGNLSECQNWRGIQLLSVPSKIYARVILERIKSATEGILREEQAGFRSGRSCTDQIASLRIIVEQSIEWNSPLYINFVDFKKAFDMVDRKTIWKVLRHYGFPQKIINVIQSLYRDTSCRVIQNSDLSDPFEVNTGVRQGCLLSPLIFSLVIDWVMKKSMEPPRGIQWTLMTKLEDLDFADDVALLTHTQQHMQSKTESLANVAKTTGLEININKTKSLRINATQTEAITIDDNAIEDVNQFTYLGSIISKTGGADEDIKTRICKARSAFAALKPVWKNENLSTHTKLRLFNTNVKSVLLYGSETWRRTKYLDNKLQVFINKCLRHILRIRWPDRISNEELLQRSKQDPITKSIQVRKWSWVGHTLRRSPEHIPRQALDWNPQGKRKRGRPPNNWRRTLQAELEDNSMTWNEAKRAAQDRSQWRSVVQALCSGRSEED